MEVDADFTGLWERKTDVTPLWDHVLADRHVKTKSLCTPDLIADECAGIRFSDGTTLRSLLFSTDLALIENSDTDAVLAVYPFSPSPRLMKSLIDFAEKPVVCGIGGGVTQGKKAIDMAQAAEQAGAIAVIVNQPFKSRDIEKIKNVISIPIISSVTVLHVDFRERVDAGVDIFHVTGGARTGEIVEFLGYALPGFPVMATGGKTMESISSSIHAGADAIVLTPPSNSDLFRTVMDTYRKGLHFLKK